MNETKFTTEKNVLTIERKFDAPLDIVWRYWTEAELLDQWWAPEPWKSETTVMEFKDGGYRLYAMVGPNGDKHWARMDFDSITKEAAFIGRDVFCDDNGDVNADLPEAHFSTQFSAVGASTSVIMITNYASEADLEVVIKMGMKEGLTMTLNKLDSILNSLVQGKK